MDTPDLNRLSILERAQHLHDATLRRHGEMLDTHADALVHRRELAEHQQRLETDLQGLLAHVVARQDQHADWMQQHAERLERSELLLSALAAEHLEHTERMNKYDAILARLDAESAHHADWMTRTEEILIRLDAENEHQAERLTQYDAILARLDAESARHAERLERLDTILQAIRDLLDRPNGRP